MRKLLEDMMDIDQEVASEAPQEAQLPEITPELMASIMEQSPELAEVDQDELEKGIAAELEHYETVGGDINIIAKIAADHIKEAPEGVSYYDALAAMEAEWNETPEEEMAETPEEEAAEEELGIEQPIEAVKEESAKE